MRSGRRCQLLPHLVGLAVLQEVALEPGRLVLRSADQRLHSGDVPNHPAQTPSVAQTTPVRRNPPAEIRCASDVEGPVADGTEPVDARLGGQLGYA